MKESNFKIHGQKLLSINYVVNDEFSFQPNFPLQIDTEISVNKNESNRTAIVFLKLKIFSDKELSQVPFKLETINAGHFEWDQKIDDKSDILLKSNAPAILLSYVRPLITQFTSFSQYPPLIIPLLDFTVDESKIK